MLRNGSTCSQKLARPSLARRPNATAAARKLVVTGSWVVQKGQEKTTTQVGRHATHTEHRKSQRQKATSKPRTTGTNRPLEENATEKRATFPLFDLRPPCTGGGVGTLRAAAERGTAGEKATSCAAPADGHKRQIVTLSRRTCNLMLRAAQASWCAPGWCPKWLPLASPPYSATE